MKTQHETQIEVDGMTCGSCVQHVRKAMLSLQGVSSVDVNLRDRRAVVQHDAGLAPVSALVSAIEDVGYSARTT